MSSQRSIISIARVQRIGTLGAAILGVMTLTPIAARAQASSSGTTYSLGASAGLALPVSDLGNLVNSGYTVGVTLGIRPAASQLGFRFEGLLDEFDWQDGIDFKRRFYAGTANLVYDLSGTLGRAPSSGNSGGFYAIGGAGLYHFNDVSDSFGDTQGDTNFGLNAGLGYRLPLSGFNAYLEARYHTIFSNTNQQMIPITFGVSF